MEWSLTGLPLPIVLRPPSPLTDDELIAFSQKNETYRIEKNAKGEIEVMAPVGYTGGVRETYVSSVLFFWAEADGRGESTNSNTGYNLPDGSTLSPDAAWIRKDRIAGFTSAQRTKYLPLCPDFVIEIRSESDSIKVLEEKMQAWIANGARLAWMIDPYKATVTIYRADSEPEVQQRPESIEAGEPVAGFRLATSRLWA